MADILEVKHLKKYFDVSAGTLHAVDDLNFHIEEGTTLGVVGESGCGKSTLGRVLIHLLESTDGQILYKGEDITRVNSKRLTQLRHDMQIIFQDPFASLNPRMTIYQTIAEPMQIAGGYSKQQIQEDSDTPIQQTIYTRELEYGFNNRPALILDKPHNSSIIILTKQKRREARRWTRI